MYITVLCKVVDNYGDIGVAWRLCRHLARIQSQYKICLVVDDFEAFEVVAGEGYHLLAGGVCLLVGAALYGVGKKKRYFHAIFHVFIDIGLTIFFIGINKYCM